MTSLNVSRQANRQRALSALAARLLLERRREKQHAELDFRRFVGRVNPRYVWYPHCEKIADVAERIAAGELKRVMLFVPPRHSKSETISRLFTAYYLRRFPEKWVGLTSYSADLAYVLSRASQENYLGSGGTMNDKAGAVKHWETGKGGGLWAAGVGGPITGKGFHLGVIDDPIKNAEEANSDIIRAKQKEWYNSTFYTRAEPGASIVIIQTRWHGDDLSGWLLGQEDESPEGWHITSLPALAEDRGDADKFPASCTVDNDWRQHGEALCPERYDKSRLEQIRGRISGYFFDALYQQRPSAKEGAFFKIGQLQIVDAVPVGLRTCRAWDLAASAGRGDFTAGVKIGVDDAGLIYVLDVQRGQLSPDDRDGLFKLTAQLDGLRCQIRIAQDPGQAGVDQSQRLIRMMAGYSIRSSRVTGEKQTRASGFASQLNAGNVRMIKGSWNQTFIEELRQFPQGKNDDQVDAAADAFNDLTMWGSLGNAY